MKFGVVDDFYIFIDLFIFFADTCFDIKFASIQKQSIKNCFKYENKIIIIENFFFMQAEVHHQG